VDKAKTVVDDGLFATGILTFERKIEAASIEMCLEVGLRYSLQQSLILQDILTYHAETDLRTHLASKSNKYLSLLPGSIGFCQSSIHLL
jgi:hypothetical protein